VLPELSHLQYLALRIIEHEKDFFAGTELRRELLARGAGNRSLPAFYLFMGRLVVAGHVTHKRAGSNVSYRITKTGKAAMRAAERFFTRDS